MKHGELDTIAIENFRRYLQIPSVQPNVNYDECVRFLRELGANVGLLVTVYELFPKKPIVVMEYPGTTNLQSIMLSSHMDVVGVELDKWKHDPFGAEMDDEGNIYGRGAQDMKCVGIQYVEAIRRLKLEKINLKRTVYIVFVPDEEIGGLYGMELFSKSEEFRKMQVAFCLDEGIANPGREFNLYYGDKARWVVVEFKCTGNGGHASLPLENTAGEALRKIIDKMSDFRQKQLDMLVQNPHITMSDIITVNVTIVQGGLQTNIVPQEFSAYYDLRLPYNSNKDELKSNLKKWALESGKDVRVNILEQQEQIPPTKLDDTNPFWKAFETKLEEMNINLIIDINPASADSKCIRKIGIPALNFSPMNFTVIRMHTHEEYLNKSIFLKGIEIYRNIIQAVANTI